MSAYGRLLIKNRVFQCGNLQVSAYRRCGQAEVQLYLWGVILHWISNSVDHWMFSTGNNVWFQKISLSPILPHQQKGVLVCPLPPLYSLIFWHLTNSPMVQNWYTHVLNPSIWDKDRQPHIMIKAPVRVESSAIINYLFGPCVKIQIWSTCKPKYFWH